MFPQKSDREIGVEEKKMVSEGGEEQCVTLELLRKKMADFAKEREWGQYHSPRNLLLALVGEVGELSEIFQWKGEVPKGLPDWKEEEKVHLGEELSDVLLYLIQLSDVCGINLAQAALRKVRLNAAKYPVGPGKGRLSLSHGGGSGGELDDHSDKEVDEIVQVTSIDLIMNEDPMLA